jgi:hypothetical protein
VAEPSVYDIYLFVAKLIQTASVVAPAPKLLIKGLELPSLEGMDEWLAYEMLLADPHVARRVQLEETYHFQLTCFTVDATRRSDGKVGRQYELASIYRPLLHQQDYMLKNTCIRFKECKITFLDLRTATFTAQAIATGGVPPLQTQSAVLLIEATIITQKE